MRHFLVGIICSVFIIGSFSVFAAPVGNVATPSSGMLKKGFIVGNPEESNFSVIIGPEVDFVFDRKLTNQISDSESTFSGAKLGVVGFNRVFLYSLLGGGDNRNMEFTVGSNAVRFDTKDDFVWGGGATILLYEKELFYPSNDEHVLRIGTDIKYRKMDFEVNNVVINGTSFTLDNAQNESGSYDADEWQIAGAVSYQFNTFFPYIGIKYSDIDGDVKAITTTSRNEIAFEAKDNFGIFIGTDVVFADIVSVNVEGRFLDEQAISFNANVRF